MKLHILILVAVVLFASVFSESSRAEVEQSVRFYTAGSLVNPSTLPLEGVGLLKVFDYRNRRYGTFEMINMIQTVAMEMATEFPKRERLQIADVANFKGGSLGKHKSHQNGLDADIIYYRKNGFEQSPSAMGFVEKFVSKGRVSSNFDTDRNWAIINKFASYAQVQRIFVDIAIKKNLCKLYSNSTDPLSRQALRILRPALLHDDHMHVRIGCPTGSTRCISQPLPAPGTGCTPTEMQMDMLDYNLEEGSGC
jgi:penicillin-insensitive murein endopeptidase